MYSGRHYGIETAFEQWSEETGVDVEFLTGNDAELRERIAAEGEDTEADVYLTVDAGNLWAAAEDGIFQPLESTVLDEAIPAQLRDEQDRWFGLAVRARTIVYNTDLVDEADVPTTYEELADPEYEGRLCLRNANNDYQQSLVASMIAADGEDATVEVLRGLGRQRRDLRQRRRAARCDGGRRLRDRRRQPLLPGPDARGAARRADRPAVGRAGRPRRAHQHLRRRRHPLRRRHRPRPAVPRVAGDRRPGRRSSPTTTSTRRTRRSRPSR